MSPEEFKAARIKLGLSMKQAGELLGVNFSTIKRWEAGEGSQRVAVNPTAARAMRWMLDGFRPPEWPARPAAGKSGPPPKDEGAD